MEQKLAEQNLKTHPKQNSQNFHILNIWKDLDKSSFEKELDPLEKIRKKADLYTQVSQKYEQKVGKSVNRSTIRRCINEHINTNSQG